MSFPNVPTSNPREPRGSVHLCGSWTVILRLFPGRPKFYAGIPMTAGVGGEGPGLKHQPCLARRELCPQRE